MINRRLIRIKIFKILFSRISSESISLDSAGKELIHSLEKTVDLYFFLLTLPIALKNYGNVKIELGLRKYHPTPQEANPNRKFVQNRVISILENDKNRKEYLSKKGLRWSDYKSFIKKLYIDIHSHSYFINYMEGKDNSWPEDLSHLTTFFETELEDNEELYQLLEDQNIYWADDLSFVLQAILKLLSTMEEGKTPVHRNMFKQVEDKEYAMHLLEHSLLHYNEYVALLRSFILNWEVDRMAATDICLIVLGISEVICCRTIPIKVTINEIVELAKYYSTPNSNLFVNGVLDKIIHHLNEEALIIKEGRGLIS